MTKIYFYTSGCRVNQYETQLLMESICGSGRGDGSAGVGARSKNYERVASHTDADVCVINSCTVTHNADADCRQIVRRILRENPSARVIVTGCYAVSAGDEIRRLSPRVEVYPEKDDVSGQLGDCAPGQPEQPGQPGRQDGRQDGQQDCRQGDAITHFAGHSKAFVKIQDGCDASCSYCIVPYVRPKLWSKPQGDVLKEISGLVRNGYKEVVLCGIRLGKYSNNGNGLCGLLREALLNTPVSISLSSIELNEVTPELIHLMGNNPGIKRHLHIPLQSADDRVLKRMNRPYTAAQFQEKISELRLKIPGIKITSDVIVGFPGETQKSFDNTRRFLRENKFDGLHVFRYSPRRGTPAIRLDGQVPSSEIKKRANVINQHD